MIRDPSRTMSGERSDARDPRKPPTAYSLHLLYVIDSLVRGGAERSLAALAPHYVSSGVRLEVAYLHDRPGLRRDLENAGARTFLLGGERGRLGWIRRAIDLVRTRDPDLIHTTLFEADLVGRVAGSFVGVPVVSSLVNVPYGREQLQDPGLRPWKVRGAQLVDAVTARRVVRFHAITEHVADVMAPRLHIRRERIDVVPRGRDVEDLGARSPERRRHARAELGLNPRTPVILTAARQEPQKGLDALLEGFSALARQIPDARLFVAGRSGRETPRLQATVARLGLHDSVRFVGERTDVPELLCAADVFVLASRWEGFASVLLEAMALEAPIVASDLPPIREVVTDGSTARLVPPGDPRALTSAIIATLADPRGTAERTNRARARFHQHFTASRVAEQMMAFYDRSLNRVPSDAS